MLVGLFPSITRKLGSEPEGQNAPMATLFLCMYRIRGQLAAKPRRYPCSSGSRIPFALFSLMRLAHRSRLARRPGPFQYLRDSNSGWGREMHCQLRRERGFRKRTSRSQNLFFISLISDGGGLCEWSQQSLVGPHGPV